MVVKKKGIFIAIDGPNGAGKSSIIDEVKKLFQTRENISVFVTKEPTNTPVGQFIKSHANEIKGKALANMVAADRFMHSEFIDSILEKEDIVISDRYLFSSYIFQCIDGVDKSYIKQVNEGIKLPDIQIVVNGDVSILRTRLDRRNSHDRFEQNSTESEIRFTEEGVLFFRSEYLKSMIFEITASNMVTEGFFENSIQVYKLIKEYLANYVGSSIS